MKIIVTIFGILIVSLAYGQDTLQFGVTTPKGINGHITDPRKIVYSGKLDFDFYNKYFNVPYDFPGLLIDTKHTNDTLIVWSDTTKVGDVKSNWSYTIIYDSNSRVKSYRYSSCMACSQLPYEYHF